jgi:hypothetical protein
MRRIGLLAILLLLAAAGFWGWTHWHPSPERQIRQRLTTLKNLLSFHASDGKLTGAVQLNRLGWLFTPEAEVRVDAPGTPRATLTGRETIVQAAAAARQATGDVEVDFLDVVVTLHPDRHSAVVEATCRVRELGSQENWIQDLRFQFIQTGEGWMITRVETVRTLTRAERRRIPQVQRPATA